MTIFTCFSPLFTGLEAWSLKQPTPLLTLPTSSMDEVSRGSTSSLLFPSRTSRLENLIKISRSASPLTRIYRQFTYHRDWQRCSIILPGRPNKRFVIIRVDCHNVTPYGTAHLRWLTILQCLQCRRQYNESSLQIGGKLERQNEIWVYFRLLSDGKYKYTPGMCWYSAQLLQQH